jgi:transcriptional regulator with XRE-family HTH domain
MITSKQAKDYRLKLGLSQNLIAKATGLSRPYLSNFEAGKFDPDHEFKETLEAFFTKQGVKLGNAEQPDNNDNDIKKAEYQEKKVIKPINGIVPDLDFISYNEAESIMGDIDILNTDLLRLSEKALPTKDDGIVFKNIVIDTDETKKIIYQTINRMAKAYLDIMTITGDNSINTVYSDDMTNLYKVTPDENYSVNDYILAVLNEADEDTTEEE